MVRPNNGLEGSLFEEDRIKPEDFVKGLPI